MPSDSKHLRARRGTVALRRPGSDAGGVLRDVALLAVGIRLVLLVVGLIATSGGHAPLGERALGLWSRWDAPHFLRVAEVGYGSTVGDDALFIVFLPGYPVLVAILSLVVRGHIVAGLLVSFAASVGAGWLLHRVVRIDTDDATAWRAVVLLFAFPSAYFLAAPYSESLFLLAVLGAVYAARTQRWARSGAAAALATATRLQALPLLGGLAVESLRGRVANRTRAARLAWVSLGALGFVVYLAINLVVHGDALHFVEVQRSHWSNRAAFPWEPLRNAVDAIAGGGLSEDLATIHWGRIGATVFVASVLGGGLSRLRLADHVYAWASLLLILSSSWLISMPRYILGIYPLFIVLATMLRTRVRFWTFASISFATQLWLFARYASGTWTF